jgi:hypothetical protein
MYTGTKQEMSSEQMYNQTASLCLHQKCTEMNMYTKNENLQNHEIVLHT